MKNDSADKQVRILVVDDHERFRQFVSKTLSEKADLCVVGEGQDGMEAVRQAQALQPDLILLDIGLPGLNGIDAARQIGKLVPKAKIIFLTQESSADIVREALLLGAWGYVVKVKAGHELLAAVEAVMRGEKFLSSGLNGHGNLKAI